MSTTTPQIPIPAYEPGTGDNTVTSVAGAFNERLTAWVNRYPGACMAVGLLIGVTAGCTLKRN